MVLNVLLVGLLCLLIGDSVSAECATKCIVVRDDVYCNNGTLTDVPGLDCIHASVHSLDLRYNKITTLTDESFSNFPYLDHLDVSGNQISSWSGGSFKRNDMLRWIGAILNNLSNLPENIFYFCPDLEYVDFSYNKLTSLPKSIFRYNTRLTYINLSVNKITVLPENVFSILPNLVTLHIYGNQLTSVPETTFQNNALVKYLDLSANNITEIKSNTFKGLSKLETLRLNANKILNLCDWNIFLDNKNLKQLNLNQNQLYTMDYMLLSNNSNLTISLYSNNWYCDCKTVLLTRFMQSRNITMFPDTTCTQPQELKNKSWKVLSETLCS